MISYKKTASAIQLLSIVIMIGAVFITITRWFYPVLYRAISDVGIAMQQNYDATALSLGQKTAGFMVEAIAVGLLLFGLMLTIQLMHYIKNTEYFSIHTIRLLKQITQVSLFYALYTPILGSLLSVITSFHNEPGHRILSLTLGSSDIYHILIFCFIFLMMTIFQKGYELKHEQELTV